MTIDAGTIDGGAANLLGVCAAARELGLNHSTVSRYLKSHPALNRGTDSRAKIDLAEFRKHHAETTNPARRGSHAGRLFGEDGGDAVVEDDPVAEANGKAGDQLTYARAKAVREGIAAQNARIDLDEKRGLLVPRDEVEAAAYEAGQALQRDLLELGAQLGERLATMGDAREIGALIDAEHRRVLAKLAAALRTQGDADVAA